MTSLDYLNLKNNQLTGSIPSEIGNVTNLTWLYLFNNQLTGEIPESICDLNINWSSSSYFSISSNQLCPPYPDCVEDYVGQQYPCSCEVDIYIVELWGQCYPIQNTTELDLSNRELTGEIPPEIGNLTNLNVLMLSWNQLTGEIPQELCDLIESNNLNISYILDGNENLINTCD